MDFEHFEGFKRIKNTKEIVTENILELLKKYETKMGAISLNGKNIKIEVDGKYFVQIRVLKKEIIIEAKYDSECVSNADFNIEEGKGLQFVKTNRLIEQLYDLINDFIKNDVITEHITSVRKVLHMKEFEKYFLKGVYSLGNCFKITDEMNDLVYEINQKKISQLYSIKNLRTKREDVVVKYEHEKLNRFTILKQPFEKIDISKDEKSVKTLFKGKISTKEIKISADYTDNHFLIEIDEIVVGAIDCLDPQIKTEYNIEINVLEYEYLVIAIAIMLDIAL